MPEPLWFAGVCDSMLRKVQYWAENWSQGDVYASDQCWSVTQGSYEVVTMRIVRVPWTRPEVDHLLRILERVKPKWSMTSNLKAAFANFDRCQLITGNQRVMLHASYAQDPRDLLEVLLQAKTGQANLAQEMEEILKKPGDGPLWG